MHARTCMQVHRMCTHAHACARVCTRVRHTCDAHHMQVHACTCTHVRACARAGVHVRACARVRVRARVHVCVQRAGVLVAPVTVMPQCHIGIMMISSLVTLILHTDT